MAYVKYPQGELWRSREDGSESLQLTYRPLFAQKMTAVLSMFLLGAFLAATAVAQCGNASQPKQSAQLHHQAWQLRDGSDGAKLILATDSLDPIVGMWQVKFVAEGNANIPDGTVIDNAFVQWHADGTEIMNSSRPPDTQSFCLGVWEKVSPGIYQLNHFAISWDQSNTTAPLGPANIRERITLASSGNSFEGRFTIDQYDSAGNNLAHIVGRLAGHRIDVNTRIHQVL